AMVAGLAPAAARALRRGTPGEASMAAGLIGYLAAQLVLFPIAVLDPVAWLLGGILLARSPGAARSGRRAPAGLGTAALVAATAGLVVAAVAAGAQLWADRQAQRSLDAADPAAAASAAERAVSLRP